MRDAAGLGIRFAAGTSEGQSAAILTSLAESVVRHRMRITVGATYPLSQATEAAKLSQAGHLRGKIALRAEPSRAG
jgi:NADPH:quinone reductase-like Zn-dependent oxidoreductase